MFGYREEDDIARIFDGIPVLKATRKPCPVCGQATGDCTGNSEPPTHIAGMGGVYESQKEIATILIEEDIFEERQITPFFKNKVLIKAKGSYATVDEAKKLGLL
jgi:hypothetical protein